MPVGYERRDGVAIVTLDRPQARNAIDRETALGVEAAVARIKQDPDVRVAILTGAGGNFCAGMDLKAFLRGGIVRLQGRFAGMTQAKLVKPFIAAVEGCALAGGFELALACDLIVASQDARFGLSEVKRGLVADADGLVRLPRQLPIKIATELLLAGDLVAAALLERHGVVNRLTPPGEALAVALVLAQTIAANGPMAVAANRRVLRDSPDWSSGALLDRQNEITAPFFAPPFFACADAREGAFAGVEKRAPAWTGM